MKEKDYYFKKFNVGLCLQTTEEKMETFLLDYNKYIDSFYFSMPLGDKHHSRRSVSRQLKNPKYIKLFWGLLRIIQDQNIGLELAFNMNTLTMSDFIASKKLLENNSIEIDTIVTLREYVEDLIPLFPNAKFIYSYNNPNHSFEDYLGYEEYFDAYVVGRNNIRNNALFDDIKNRLYSDVILLVNNGCNYFCPGVCYLRNCTEIFNKTIEKIPVEELYAYSSLMPFELNEGYIDTSNISLLKISNRSGTIEYTKRCIDSYMSNDNEANIKNDISDYLLWSRLAPFYDYFNEFDLDRIIKTKKSLYTTNKNI